jgi:uncharacterized protein (DUF1015 family)
MAELRPFRALVYNPARVGPLGAVWAPPYDVIGPAERAALAARHPHNVVRLILPEGAPDPYAAAAARLADWVAQGILVREREPSVRVHAHAHGPPGAERTRTGLWAALRLEPFERGVVLPHERTMPGPKADRLALWRACRTQLSAVFLVAEDPEGAWADALAQVARRPPDETAEFPEGERHRIWRVAGDAADALTAALRDARLLIADGHHRYETALALREIAQTEGWTGAAPDYVLAYVVSERDPGLEVQPTHRVLARSVGAVPAAWLERAETWFDVELRPEGSSATILEALGAVGPARAAFAAVLRDVRGWALLAVRPDAERELAPPLRSVGVAALHDLFLPRVAGLDPEAQRAGDRIAYTRDADEAVGRVRAGEADAAFLVRPPSFAQMREAALAGERMPPKTTYFAPKVPTGVALRPLDE